MFVLLFSCQIAVRITTVSAILVLYSVWESGSPPCDNAASRLEMGIVIKWYSPSTASSCLNHNRPIHLLGNSQIGKPFHALSMTTPRLTTLSPATISTRISRPSILLSQFGQAKMRRSTRPFAHELTDIDNTIASPDADRAISPAFPEGGCEAWACLLGSSLMLFPSFGFQTASAFPSKESHRQKQPLI